MPVFIDHDAILGHYDFVIDSGAAVERAYDCQHLHQVPVLVLVHLRHRALFLVMSYCYSALVYGCCCCNTAQNPAIACLQESSGHHSENGCRTLRCSNV